MRHKERLEWDVACLLFVYVLIGLSSIDSFMTRRELKHLSILALVGCKFLSPSRASLLTHALEIIGRSRLGVVRTVLGANHGCGTASFALSSIILAGLPATSYRCWVCSILFLRRYTDA